MKTTSFAERILNNKRKIIFDVLLIFVCLSVGFLSFIIIEANKEEGAYVRVSINGELKEEYSLSEDGEYSINGGSNILVIEGGAAYVRYADCPDGLCVNQGKISRTGERITCLPNRVMVDVVGAGEEILGN